MILPISGTAVAQTGEEVFFKETGHYVRGEFLNLYRSVGDDALLLFGYPITDEYTDTQGNTVQYFQRVRMNLKISVTGTRAVLAPLGTMLYSPSSNKADINTSSPTCRYFETTGKSVCYAFAQFYNFHHGAEVLGLPISDVELNGSGYIQYFTNGALTWRTDLPTGQRVVMADLGRIGFDEWVDDPALLAGRSTSAIPGSKLSTLAIQARAFAAQPLVSLNSQQTIYIVVQDQKFKPISGASVTVTIVYPDGSSETLSPSPTNSYGFTTVPFTVTRGQVKEIVRVDSRISYQGAVAQSITSFRIWW